MATSIFKCGICDHFSSPDEQEMNLHLIQAHIQKNDSPGNSALSMDSPGSSALSMDSPGSSALSMDSPGSSALSMDSPGSSAPDENSTATCRTWSTSAVKLLIASYKENEDKFSDIKWPNKKVWNIIATSIQSHGHQFSGNDCNVKWRNLKLRYKKIKDSNSRTGQHRSKWEFYTDMDNVLGEKPDVEPPAVFESSEATLRLANGTTESSASGDVQSQSQSVKKKRKFEDWYEDFKKMKEESREERRKQHEEAMELRRKKDEDTKEFQQNLLSLLSTLINK